MDRKRKRGVRQLGRGVLAGALGGLIGGWTMGRSAALWEKLSGKPDGVSRSELARLEARQFVSGSSQELDSISKVADWIDARLFRHGLSPTQKGIAAALVHYSAGAALGAVYGALAEVAPGVTKGWGVPFGVAESLTI
ncbi:MAG TPA: hypothetical protein VFM10_10860, partial [Terriglobales bacterium]|nr:hypothetical protein [Terriglobales bacterium]